MLSKEEAEKLLASYEKAIAKYADKIKNLDPNAFQEIQEKIEKHKIMKIKDKKKVSINALILYEKNLKQYLERILQLGLLHSQKELEEIKKDLPKTLQKSLQNLRVPTLKTPLVTSKQIFTNRLNKKLDVSTLKEMMDSSKSNGNPDEHDEEKKPLKPHPKK